MTPRPVSFRRFAKAQGVTLSSIQRAVFSGRLTPASVGVDSRGRHVLLDPARAAQELAAHSRPRLDFRKANGHSNEHGGAPTALADATLRERRARAWATEVQVARLVRDLVPAKEVELKWSGLIVEARTSLLGIPSRMKQRAPHLSNADLAALDGLLREILEELATSRAAGNEAAP